MNQSVLIRQCNCRAWSSVNRVYRSTGRRGSLEPARLVLACKTGGFQESKFNYFNDLQKLRCQLIRLSIRAGTGIEPFKTKAYTGGREIGFGGLVHARN